MFTLSQATVTQALWRVLEIKSKPTVYDKPEVAYSTGSSKSRRVFESESCSTASTWVGFYHTFGCCLGF
jgi:hypothetical protein